MTFLAKLSRFTKRQLFSLKSCDFECKNNAQLFKYLGYTTVFLSQSNPGIKSEAKKSVNCIEKLDLIGVSAVILWPNFQISASDLVPLPV